MVDHRPDGQSFPAVAVENKPEIPGRSERRRCDLLKRLVVLGHALRQNGDAETGSDRANEGHVLAGSKR